MSLECWWIGGNLCKITIRRKSGLESWKSENGDLDLFLERMYYETVSNLRKTPQNDLKTDKYGSYRTKAWNFSDVVANFVIWMYPPWMII
jgi:hypothetical protein